MCVQSKPPHCPSSPLPAKLYPSSLQGLHRDIVTHQRRPFAKMTQACFCKWGLWMDGFLCALFTPSFAVTLESKGILCKATEEMFQLPSVYREHTHKGHLITPPLPTEPGPNPQPSREPSRANSYRCRVKCELGISITKGRLLLSLFFICLEYCLNCELSF